MSPSSPLMSPPSSDNSGNRKRKAKESGLRDGGVKKKQFKPEQLEWRGRLKDRHSKKTFDVKINYLAGTQIHLKKFIPKTLQTNGRIRYSNIDAVLPMLTKVSASKSHLLFKLSHNNKDKSKKREYDKTFEDYETAERGMVIDLKDKCGFKMYILPPCYDADDCQINRDMVKTIWGSDPPEGQPWGYLLYYHKNRKKKDRRK